MHKTNLEYNNKGPIAKEIVHALQTRQKILWYDNGKAMKSVALFRDIGAEPYYIYIFIW